MDFNKRPLRDPESGLWNLTIFSDEFSPCTECLAGCSQCRDCIHCIDHPEEDGCDKCQHCEPCIGCAACVSGDCPVYSKCTDCTLCMPCLKDPNLPGCDKVSFKTQSWPTEFSKNTSVWRMCPMYKSNWMLSRNYRLRKICFRLRCLSTIDRQSINAYAINESLNSSWIRVVVAVT